MTMREKMVAKMAALDGYLNWHSLHDKRRYEEFADAALDALMQPTDDVMAEGYNAAYAADTGVDEMAEVVVEHAYVAMIRAIKEGK